MLPPEAPQDCLEAPRPHQHQTHQQQQLCLLLVAAKLDGSALERLLSSLLHYCVSLTEHELQTITGLCGLGVRLTGLQQPLAYW